MVWGWSPDERLGDGTRMRLLIFEYYERLDGRGNAVKEVETRTTGGAGPYSTPEAGNGEGYADLYVQLFHEGFLVGYSWVFLSVWLSL